MADIVVKKGFISACGALQEKMGSIQVYINSRSNGSKISRLVRIQLGMQLRKKTAFFNNIVIKLYSNKQVIIYKVLIVL